MLSVAKIRKKESWAGGMLWAVARKKNFSFEIE